MPFKHVLHQHCSQRFKGEVEKTALLCLSLLQPALGLDCLSLLQPAIGLGFLSPWQPAIGLDCLSLPQPVIGLGYLSLLHPAIGLECWSPPQRAIGLHFSLHFLLGLMSIHSLFTIFSLALPQFRQNGLHFIPNEYQFVTLTAPALTSSECCVVFYLAFLCHLRGDCFNSLSFRIICSK